MDVLIFFEAPQQKPCRITGKSCQNSISRSKTCRICKIFPIWSRPDLSSGCSGVQDLSSGSPGRHVFVSRIAFPFFFSSEILPFLICKHMYNSMSNLYFLYQNDEIHIQFELLYLHKLQVILLKIN